LVRSSFCSFTPLLLCDTSPMTIPVYRHNQDHDDWEVASVYDSDDSDSLGRSAYNESVHSSGSPNNPALQNYLYGDTRPRVGYPVPQQQHQNYPPAPYPRPRLEARYAPGKQSSFIVPPPGVIFPRKDWALPSQDSYQPRTPVQIVPSLVDAGLVEPPSLLLSPSSPPRASSPLIRRPSPTTPIARQPPHGMTSGSGTVTNVNTHASPMMPPPPRYHDLAHPISPRLADAGCQAHASTVMSPPRRSGHDIYSSSYAPAGPGRAQMPMPMPMPRGAQSSEEMTVVDGRYGGGLPSYGPGERSDLHPPPQGVPRKYEYEREREGAGRTGTWPLTRERRPSVWRRFVRRFNPSHVSVGQT